MLTIYATHYAYRNLPLPTATMIGYTEPIMQALFALIFLHISVSWQHWIIIFFGYVGVGLVIFSKTGGNILVFQKAVFIGLLANLLAVINNHIVKRLARNEPSHQVVFYKGILILVYASLTLSIIPGTCPDKLPAMKILMVLFFIGCLAALEQYSFTRALSYLDPHIISPISYCKLLFALPIGMIFYHETLTNIGLLGGVIILGSNWLLFQEKRKT